MTELIHQSARELAEKIRARRVSATEVVDAFLARIAARNPDINAIATLDEENARERARRADDALARGECWGPLHGVPVTVKDSFNTAGLRTTAGHRPLADNVPEEDATVVARLRAAGAILLGKTNLPTLAMDVQTDNPIFGPTRNPWNRERTAGGSSGGEAAALAAGMTALGVGSDIGGSVRIPAHYCGVCALKPTEGRVPIRGHIFPGSGKPVRHLAVPGPMARSVADLRLGLAVLDGSAHEEVPPKPLREHRFVWTDRFGGLPVSAETRAAMNGLADDLSDAGCRVERVNPELDFELLWQTYGELFGAIAGVLFPAPLRVVNRLVGPLAARDIISRAGARASTASLRRYFDILDERDRLAGSLDGLLAGYDGWLCPVTPTSAPPLRRMGRIHTPLDVDGERIPGNLTTAYTCPFNLTGHPAVTVPLGIGYGGLPIGLQVVGRRSHDVALLAAAEAVTEVIGALAPPVTAVVAAV